MRRAANTAVTARRLGLLTVVGVVVAGVFGGFAVLAAGGSPTFGLAGSPSSQSVVQSFTAATYTVQIARQNGFTGAVSLSVTSVPAGASASFSPNPTTTTGITSTLTVTRTGSVATGTYVLAIKGVSGNKSATANVNLVVTSATPPPSFTINVSPSTQTLLQGDQVAYAASITRLNGYGGNVSLTVSGLPKKTTASFSPIAIVNPNTTSTLTIVADKNAEEGSFSPIVTGTGSVGGIVRTVSFGLIVEKTRDFPIAGNVTGLYPGLTKPLDLALTNPNNFPLRIVSLTVAVEQATSKGQGCAGGTNFVASPPADYTNTGFYSGPAIVVPANQTRTLSALGVPSNKWPWVKMNETGGDQDACKSTIVYLQYSGQGVKP